MSRKKVSHTPKNNNKKDNTQIYVAIIGLAGTIIVAVFGWINIYTQQKIPLSATMTAEARSTSGSADTSTLLSATDILLSATPNASSTPFNIPDSPILGDTWTRPTDGETMVYVPGGKSLMGSSISQAQNAWEECQKLYGKDSCGEEGLYMDETPQHFVTLSSFWLDRTEISHSQYMLCVANGVCEVPNYASIMPFNLGDHPVVGVSWENAMTYCAWAGAKLPSEAQWEYAARGEPGLMYSWGNDFDGNLLNYCDAKCAESYHANDFNDGFPETAPVDIYQAGASWNGALNLNGNVCEWVNDWFGPYNSSEQADPTGPSSGTYKVVRGGSWINDLLGVRSTNRSFPDPSERSKIVGFRCVINLK